MRRYFSVGLAVCMRHFHTAGKTLIADREYIGTQWFKFLSDKGIKFIIRSRNKSYKDAVNTAQGPPYEQMVGKVCRSKVPDKAVRKVFFLDRAALYFVVVKNPDPKAKKPVILLITNINEHALKVAAAYPIRWKIEHCFKHLKSSGFCLENINLSGKARPKLLMAVVVFAYSVVEGLKSYKAVKVKTYSDESQHKAVSVCRYGLSPIANFCSSVQNLCAFLTQEIERLQGKYRSPDASIVW